MKINRRGFLKATAGLTVLGVAGAVGGVGSYEYGVQLAAKWLTVERVEIPLKNLKPALEGLKIVQLSDLHLYPYTQLDLIQQAIQTTNALNPDVVVLTGDYVLSTAEAIFDLAPTLSSLNARYGVFSILGNHDLWTNADVIRAGFAANGLPVLHNEGIDLDIGGELLYLAGVDDGWSGQPDLKTALNKHRGEIPVILLAHEPDLADQFAGDGRVSLQLSGHSHGGQVRVPGLGALVLPHLGQKYDQGLNRVNDMWVYTNRGLGVIPPPVRLNCRPEITEITLVGTG